MKVWPLRFRRLRDGSYVFSNESGVQFFSDESFLERYACDRLTEGDASFLLECGCAYEEEGDFFYTSYLHRFAVRQTYSPQLAYIILVPTLRCNLSCGYCQVSRASETAPGFDWSEEVLSAVIAFLHGLEAREIKIEFQGGEPLLRVDLLERVRAFCRERFESVEFVVCTNLQRLGARELAFLDHDDVRISTSLDGDRAVHQRNRTRTESGTDEFFRNLTLVLERYGRQKISALPTIDFRAPPDLAALIDAYNSLGLRSIYLRPVHYHGFARKKHTYVNAGIDTWLDTYLSFIEMLIEWNWAHDEPLEEYHFSLCLGRVLRAGLDRHVDLRNPSPFAADYIVVDYDGQLYPTDEARMLARIGEIDLSIGDVRTGVDRRKTAQINLQSVNCFHEDCTHCAYQPFCGVDLVDDLARYGRIDFPKLDTWFCRQQMAIFDRIFEYVASDDEKVCHSLAHWTGVAHWPRSIAARHHDTAAASRQS